MRSVEYAYGNFTTGIYSNSKVTCSLLICIFSRALVLVLSDGSVALCGGASEASPLVGLSLSHWVVPSPPGGCRATCARIGWLTQTIAVGCSNGEVAIYRWEAACSNGEIQDGFDFRFKIYSHRTQAGCPP